MRVFRLLGKELQRAVHVGALVLTLALVAPAWAEIEGLDVDAYMASLTEAVNEAIVSLNESGMQEGWTIALVPLGNDPDDRGYELVQEGISTKTRFRLFDRQDEEWQRLLGEIEWNQRRESEMDVATIQKFGSIQGVQSVMWGRIMDVRSHPRAKASESDPVSLRLSLHVSEVETGEHQWGKVVYIDVPELTTGDRFLQWLRVHQKALLIIMGAVVGLWIIVGVTAHATRPM